MPPTFRTVLGAILLIVGIADLLKFGLVLLVKTPALIAGILLTIAGAALLGSGRRNSRLLP